MSAYACVLMGGPIHTIAVGERSWRFEDHPYCGPSVVGARGDPLSTQPSRRSSFWRACDLWIRQGRRLTKEGDCVWSEPPKSPWLQIRGTRHLMSDSPEHRHWLSERHFTFDVVYAEEQR